MTTSAASSRPPTLTRLSGADSLPKLQFKKADTLIKLGTTPDDWLLVHSSNLGQVFGAGASKDWAKYSDLLTVGNPKTGGSISVRIVALKQLDDTYFLEDKEVSIDEEEEPVALFQDSSYAESGWPRFRRSCDLEIPLDITVKALRLMFSLLHGAEVTLKQLLWHVQGRLNRWEDHDLGLCILICACSYAEFGSCLDLVRRGAIYTLRSMPCLWEHVSQSPKKYMALACKLHDSELYHDAFRHRAAQACVLKKWEESFATDTGIAIEQLRNDFETQHLCLKYETDHMSRFINSLQLQPTRVRVPGSGWHNTSTTFMNLLRFKDANRSDQVKASERIEFIARAHFGQWLAQQMYGEQVWKDDLGDLRGNDSHSKHFNAIVRNLEQAAAAPNPASIFGLSTPRRLAGFFTLASLGNSTQRVQRTLRNLVVRANQNIQQTFPQVGESFTRTNNEGVEEEFIYGRAHFDAGCIDGTGYYTYMAVPAKTPFSDISSSASDSAKGHTTLRDVDLEDASPELIRELWKTC